MKNVAEMKTHIQNLTNAIADHITKKTFDELPNLLNQRQVVLDGLLGIDLSQEEVKGLYDFINELRLQDQVLMTQLAQERDQVKHAVLQIGKMKQYTQE